MDSLEALTKYIVEKATEYLRDTGETVNAFPVSIAEFVIEYAMNGCNFPRHFAEKNKVEDLEKGKSSLVMACIDIYSKAGAEGQISHSENGISRTYKNSWISFDLLSRFPNYVDVF